MKRQNNEIVSIGRGVALQTDRQTESKKNILF